MGYQNNKQFNFWGYEEIVGIFGGVVTKLDYLWGSFLNILGLFYKVKVQNGNIFWGC